MSKLICKLNGEDALVKIAFEPVAGKHYYVYGRSDDCFLSMIEPEFWSPRFELIFLAEVEYIGNESWTFVATE